LRGVTRLAAIVVLLTAAAAAAAAPTARVSTAVDSRLCPFPLAVTVTQGGAADQVATSVLHFELDGPSTVALRNVRTGRTAVLRSPGSFAVDTRTGSVTFHGRHVWYWSTGKHVPYLSTTGTGTLRAPSYVLAPGTSRARVIDPCALVAATAPSTKPRVTPAPWGLPPYALSQIGYARLTPLVGAVIRHDHVHLDVIVDGRRVAVPAGVGIAEPVDNGPCPPLGGKNGDCATRHGFFGRVANSPLHTHSASGIIHVEADRPGAYTLGQFFDEWGVRLGADCVGGYCSGGGKELRVYVDGRRRVGDPRRIVLRNRQEIAIVFGSGRVPSAYTGGWPGAGCGGAGERSCIS
jgi:hypothetical protein